MIMTGKLVKICKIYPKFSSLIHGNTSIEGRACAFWVKEENRALFVSQFNKLFSNDFLLLSKQEVLNMNLFGTGKNHHNFKDSIGDYLAVGTGNRYFELNYYPEELLTHHAGLTEQEMLIPIIIP